jgi:hypothetical protein
MAKVAVRAKQALPSFVRSGIGLVAKLVLNRHRRATMAEHQPTDWKIFCVVVKENISFLVNISPDATVGDLKDAIKTKTQPAFDHFAANSLALYLVNLPDDDDLAKHVDQHLAIKPPLTVLQATKRVRALFPDGDPGNKTIRILVQPPSSRK